MRRPLTLFALLALPLAPAVVPAQAIVRGTVFDSLLTRRPLEGATVVVQGTALTATTDRRGQYEIRGLAAGRYALGFFHPMLDSLDIAAPGRIIEIGTNEQLEVALATPSPNGASLLLCRVAAAPATAVLFGTVRSAEDGTPLRGAEARVRWFEVVIARGGARQTEHVARDSTDAEGRFRLCGVPNDISLTLVASHEGQATGPLYLELDSAGVARRDLRVSRTDLAARILPDAVPDDTVAIARPGGRGNVTVLVRNSIGNPIRRAIVGVRGWTASDVTDDSGRAVIPGVPSGTQTVVVRAIGMQPQHHLVDVTPDRETRVVIGLDRFITLLPTVAVTGQRPDPLTQQINRRIRIGQGQLIQGEQLQDLALSPSGWARIPGVAVGGGTDPVPTMRGQFGSRCTAAIWLDGMRVQASTGPTALRGMEGHSVTGWELRGMLLNAKRVEVYNSAARVPIEYANVGMNACGAILIWSY